MQSRYEANQLRHRANRLSKAQQRYQEERAANRQQRQELRPDDAKPSAAVKYRLREADKMGSWHSQHYVLHRLRHAFTRCRTTREHL